MVWAGWRVLSFDYRGLDHLLYGLTHSDLIAGSILLVATLELARRSVGTVMLLVGLVFILYSAYGNFLPDVLASRGFSFERIVRFQIFTGAWNHPFPLSIRTQIWIQGRFSRTAVLSYDGAIRVDDRR